MCTYANGGECQQLFQVLLIGIKGMHHSPCEGGTAISELGSYDVVIKDLHPPR